MNLEIDIEKVERKLEAAGMPAKVREQALGSVVAALQTNVALRLEEALSDEELKEFQKLAEANDPAEGITWLTKRFPDYSHVVDDELDKLIKNMQSTVAGIKKAAQDQGE